MSNFVRLFMPRFAPMVESGEKRQTVRPTPKRMPKAGDTISLREWTGKPYRSKQRVLKEATVTKVAHFRMTAGGHVLVDYHLPPLSFAVDDGFSCEEEMRQWFEHEHGLPFTGIVIFWQ